MQQYIGGQKPDYPEKPEKKALFLECGCNPEAAIFEIDDGRIECDQEFVLDRVKVDTTHLKNPLVKIEFSSLVAFEAEDDSGSEHEVEVELLFKLERVCDGWGEYIQTWKYEKEFEVEDNIDELKVEISEPFTVTFCDRPCSDCCEYRMIVEGKDFEGEFEYLRVVKPNLSAIVQGY